MKNERTVRYTLDKLPAGRIDRSRVRGMSADEVESAASSDPDNPPATEEELAGGEIVFPSDRRKIPTYIRFDPEIVEFFKREGPGYQTRINAALLDHIRRQEGARRTLPADRARPRSARRTRFSGGTAWSRAHFPRPFQPHGS